ncbi:MAG TPA: hypothetical protein VFT82_00560 [Candidatus Paceibacterota bacterium]|nr:hypothetical protein [Candidatus Paceibacterota bacterium]
MKYRNIIIALGILIVIIHFLGFPSSIDNVIYSILGLLIIALAYMAGKTPGPTV